MNTQRRPPRRPSGHPANTAAEGSPRPGTPPPGAATRAAAARVLAEVDAGRSLKAVLAQVLPSLKDSRDRALCESICHAALRRRVRYGVLVQALIERPLPGQAKPVQMLLHVGLAQLEHLGLAEHAAVAATAEAARVLGFPRHVGLVNAVLRRFLRERASLPMLTPAQEAERAHPPWLLAQLRTDWPQHGDAILLANLQPAPLWLRLNPTRARLADVLAGFEAIELTVQQVDAERGAVALREAGDPTRLPGWDEGHFLVQDIAAQGAVEALAVGPGLRVLDACAAPGGKAAQIAASGAHLLALDSDPRRLPRVQQTLDRLGLRAELRCADATQVDSWWNGQAFDRILIDAPCSGSGVVRRQPDILVHRRADDIARLVAQQAALLQALWPLLAVGGRLVYATCSVLKDENERQIDAFLAAHADAEPVLLGEHFGVASGRGRQRLPGDGDGDGFFIAALLKRA